VKRDFGQRSNIWAFVRRKKRRKEERAYFGCDDTTNFHFAKKRKILAANFSRQVAAWVKDKVDK
jgi:hypothetical protein